MTNCDHQIAKAAIYFNVFAASQTGSVHSKYCSTWTHLCICSEFGSLYCAFGNTTCTNHLPILVISSAYQQNWTIKGSLQFTIKLKVWWFKVFKMKIKTTINIAIVIVQLQCKNITIRYLSNCTFNTLYTTLE